VSAPGLLSVNPELQRNLWLELTVTRLIAAPIVLMAVLGVVDSVSNLWVAERLARFLLWALLTLWGSRLAAESFGDEAAGRTWDAQRLSTQGAWGLTLGKLAGGTAFVWYATAVMAIILLGLGAEDVGGMVYGAALGGLTAQSAALFVVLLLHRFDPRGRRAQATTAQIAGILIGWNGDFLSVPTSVPNLINVTTLDWWGMDFPAKTLIAAIRVVAIAWIVFGSMRLVRRELGHRDGPLGWTLYTLYTIVLVQGFAVGAVNTANGVVGAAGLPHWLSGPAQSLGVQSLVVVTAFALAYLAAFGMPVSRMGLAKLRSAIGIANWVEAWRNLPAWAPGVLVAAVAAIFLSMRLASSTLDVPAPQTTISALGFLLRDIALITLMRLVYRRRTAVALLVMFMILYSVLPALLTHLSGGVFVTLVYPGTHPAAASPVLPWLEAAAAWYFVWRRLAASAQLAKRHPA